MTKKSVQSAHWLDGEYICTTCGFELDYHTPTQACAVCGTKPEKSKTDYTLEKCTCQRIAAEGKIVGIMISPHCRIHYPGPR